MPIDNQNSSCEALNRHFVGSPNRVVSIIVEYEKDGEVYYNIVDSVEPLFSDENVTIIKMETA